MQVSGARPFHPPLVISVSDGAAYCLEKIPKKKSSGSTSAGVAETIWKVVPRGGNN